MAADSSDLCETFRRIRAVIKPYITTSMPRNYDAFQAFLDKSPYTAVVQKESVIGSKGGKCLLTIHFVKASLMLAFIRDANISKTATDIYEMLHDKLGKPLFKSYYRLF